jgi:primosomal protein N' (replication factor Y)
VAAIAQVEPLTRTRALRGPFDYALPEELRASVHVGSTLVVPFGHRDMLGVVVALAEHSSIDRERLLAPRRAVGDGVPAELVELARWMADEYCSTFARALGLVLPPGSGVGPGGGSLTRLVATISAGGESALHDGSRLTEAQREVLELLRLEGPVQANATGAPHAALRRLEARGLIELARTDIRRRPEQFSVKHLKRSGQRSRGGARNDCCCSA